MLIKISLCVNRHAPTEAQTLLYLPVFSLANMQPQFRNSTFMNVLIGRMLKMQTPQMEFNFSATVQEVSHQCWWCIK